ncbi:MAG TPA: hypothetical protein VF041_04165 [Gemmatimonadaceae bacterium]
MTMTISRPVHALLQGVVDYAGLFPPAERSMSEAVAAYAAYRAGPDAWALGRFVVPVARLDELAGAVAAHGAAAHGQPWPLSVLAGAGPAADAERVAAFGERHGARLRVEAVEAKGATTEQIDAVRRAFPAPLELYVEVPIDGDPTALVRHIGAIGARAKVRTGGVTPGAFPAPAALARFLAACAAERVPFKATAGLHHPLRAVYPLTYAPDAPTGTMFGYLNVFLAAAWLREGMPVADAERLLDERSPEAVRFDDDGVAWREHRLSAERLEAARREHAIGFGSCSFTEPLADLRSLALLPPTP